MQLDAKWCVSQGTLPAPLLLLLTVFSPTTVQLALCSQECHCFEIGQNPNPLQASLPPTADSNPSCAGPRGCFPFPSSQLAANRTSRWSWRQEGHLTRWVSTCLHAQNHLSPHFTAFLWLFVFPNTRYTLHFRAPDIVKTVYFSQNPRLPKINRQKRSISLFTGSYRRSIHFAKQSAAGKHLLKTPKPINTTPTHLSKLCSYYSAFSFPSHTNLIHYLFTVHPPPQVLLLSGYT